MKSRYKGEYGKVLCPKCESDMLYDGIGTWVCSQCTCIIEDDELEDYAKFSDLTYDAIWVTDPHEFDWHADD